MAELKLCVSCDTLAKSTKKSTKKQIRRCPDCCHYKVNDYHRVDGVHVCPPGSEGHQKKDCPTENPAHHKEETKKSKAIKETMKNTLGSTSFKKDLNEFAKKKGIDLTGDDTTVRVDVLQGMLNEVKKNPHVEVLPKEMYKKYSDYRNSRQEEQRKPKKRKTIDVTSDEDSQDIRNELEDTVHQIEKLKRKKLRLEAGLEAMDSYKQKEKIKREAEEERDPNQNRNWLNNFYPEEKQPSLDDIDFLLNFSSQRKK